MKTLTDKHDTIEDAENTLRINGWMRDQKANTWTYDGSRTVVVAPSEGGGYVIEDAKKSVVPASDTQKHLEADRPEKLWRNER